MNSANRSGHTSVILAAITSAITAVIFVGVLLCAAAAHGAVGDSSIMNPLVRAEGSNTVAIGSDVLTGASGSVLVEKKGTTQRLIVQARGVPYPSSGLGVFLGPSPIATNGAVFLNVMSASLSGSNVVWKLELVGQGAPPPLLANMGFQDVSELAGLYLFVADTETNVALTALMTPLVPKPSVLSYRNQAPMLPVDPNRSPGAGGRIKVKYDGKKGTSCLEEVDWKVTNGNAYCIGFSWYPDLDGWTCDCTHIKYPGTRALNVWDTSKGDDLPGGVELGYTMIGDLAGAYVFIIDTFGNVHLRGQIPGCPKKTNCPN